MNYPSLLDPGLSTDTFSCVSRGNVQVHDCGLPLVALDDIRMGVDASVIAADECEGGTEVVVVAP